MVMMVPPPAEAKTRLPAGFLTALALLYNQCLPSLAPGRCTRARMHAQTLADINKNTWIVTCVQYVHAHGVS